MKKYMKISLNKRLNAISMAAFIPMFLVMLYLLVSLSGATKAYADITQSVTYANQYAMDFKERMDNSMYLSLIHIYKTVLRLDFNLVLEMINLVVLFLILRKFLFRPVMNIMEKRKAMIAEGLKNADEMCIRDRFETARDTDDDDQTAILLEF